MTVFVIRTMELFGRMRWRLISVQCMTNNNQICLTIGQIRALISRSNSMKWNVTQEQNGRKRFSTFSSELSLSTSLTTRSAAAGGSCFSTPCSCSPSSSSGASRTPVSTSPRCCSSRKDFRSRWTKSGRKFAAAVRRASSPCSPSRGLS